MSAWCHGAPGIALSRLAAAALFGEEADRAEAGCALRATRAAVAHALEAGRGNLGLCHGLLGNAAVLARGCEVLDGCGEGDLALVRAAADAGLSCLSASAHGVETAIAEHGVGFMNGLCGIAFAALRLRAAGPRDPAQVGPLARAACFF
jgi:lantibiotic modifying enzyme